VAHHPQAIYFGTRQGRLPAGSAPDDLIKGSSRDPSLFGSAENVPELADKEPAEGVSDSEEEPVLTGG
jgi:5-methyltetrahydrofolate--homocysteine methyltransferase